MGAGTCLILAGTAALVFVSTLIAFQGWPGVRADAKATNAALLSAVRDEGRLAVSRPARVHLPAAVHVAASRRARRAAADRAAARRAVSRASLASVDRRRDVTSLPVVHVVQPPTTVVKPKAKATLGAPVRQVGTQLDQTVSDTGKTLGDAVTPVAPSVGSLVTSTTAVVGDVVTRVTDVAGQLVDGLGTTTTP